MMTFSGKVGPQLENSPREEANSCRRGRDGGWGGGGGGVLETDQFWHENGEVMKNIRAFSSPACATLLQFEGLKKKNKLFI